MPAASSAATAIRSAVVGVDGNGRAAIEWGVYGVPETFVVGRDGTIVYKLVGPITPANLDSVLKVEIDKALKTIIAGVICGVAAKHRTSGVSSHIGNLETGRRRLE